MIFSEKLYKLRKNKGLSQEQLAEQLLISRQAISKWESGTAMPESDKLLAISRFFDVSLDYLMKEEIEEAALTNIGKSEWVQDNSKGQQVTYDTRGKSGSLVGTIICITGILGLLIWGLITVFNPTASSQISESSAIHIDGNGIFLILCVAAIVLGAGFLLKKPGNGAQNEKNKSCVFDTGSIII